LQPEYKYADYLSAVKCYVVAMVCVLIQGVGKTMSTLTEKDRLCLVCKSSQHVEDEVRNTILFLIALCTVILEPDMQVSFSKLFLYQTFLLGVNQMHVVVSLGAVFLIGVVVEIRSSPGARTNALDIYIGLNSTLSTALCQLA